MTTDHPRPFGIALGVSAVAALAVLFTLGDPGITSDEPIDVRVGRNYLELGGQILDKAQRRGWNRLGRAEVEALFLDNKQHPPLGRLLVGVASVVGEPFEGLLGGSDPFSVHAARLAPMLAFAGLVGLVSWTAARRYGRAAGLVAGGSLLVMPRVFAHGHFATLDTILCLFWTLALFRASSALEGPRPVRGMTFAGLAWGLALLTKIHAWLLPPVVLVAALAYRRILADARSGRRLGSGRPRRVFRRLALALVRHARPPCRISGHERPPLAAQGGIFWPGVSRSRRPLALPVGLFRRDGPARAAPAGGHRRGLGLAGPQDGPLPARPGRDDPALAGRVQHEGAGVRRRAALSGRLPALGGADRPGIRKALVIHPAEMGARACWSPCC